MAYVDGFIVPVPKKSMRAKVMKDKRLAAMMDPKKMPFDGKRFIYGGFRVEVDL